MNTNETTRCVPMKLYLVKRKDDHNYDEYDSCVVVATSVADAVSIHPGKSENRSLPTYWTPSNLDVTYLGKPEPEFGRGIICSSFNAG